MPTIQRQIARLLVGLLAGLGGLVLIIAETPITDWVGAPLQVYGSLRKADAIVILSGGMYEEGVPSDATLRRLTYGLRLWREGYAPVILLSGGKVFTAEAESDSMLHVAEGLGFPEPAFVIERRATRTSEQARAISAILRARGMTQVILVTSRTHSYRAMKAFEKAGVPVIPGTVDPLPWSVRATTRHRWFATDPVGFFGRVYEFGKISYEYAAVALYWWRGWI